MDEDLQASSRQSGKNTTARSSKVCKQLNFVADAFVFLGSPSYRFLNNKEKQMHHVKGQTKYDQNKPTI
jgi:hypothetical protein